MKTTHTPGPWESIGARICTEGNDRERRVIARMEPFDLNKMAERDANARLIAAAPDLLDACKAILTLLEQGQADTLTLEHDGAYLRESIAKAEGRQ